MGLSFFLTHRSKYRVLMNKYKYLLVSAVLLAISLWGYQYLVNNKKQRKIAPKKIQKTVFTEIVKNGQVPIIINERGSLQSKYRVMLFSEVQGVLKNSRKEFRVGVSYKKGEILLNINSDEHEATLKAQKSIFQNLIVSIIPDLRMDYPESFEKWKSYLKRFEVENPIEIIPKPDSDKEKYFITAKNIYTTYYNIKNLEVRLSKYNIRAPFDGVITEANVNKGSLVRVGQNMGAFINTGTYELALSINASLANDLRIGKKVLLTDLSKTIEVTGKVVRISGKIDTTSQTLEIYIEVKGADLREGMYLEARVFARNVQDAYEIPRKLLIGKERVFVFQDSVLQSVRVTPVFYKENSIIVKGLEDGVELVSKPILGAFVGMPVKEFNPSKE
jgi:multidrug efflux pump subunit AcrA (membrane-fusion protein)